MNSLKPRTRIHFTEPNSYVKSCKLKGGIFSNFLKKIVKCLFIFERERERQTECEWRRGREMETQNSKEAPGSKLSAQSPPQGSNS